MKVMKEFIVCVDICDDGLFNLRFFGVPAHTLRDAWRLAKLEADKHGYHHVKFHHALCEDRYYYKVN